MSEKFTASNGHRMPRTRRSPDTPIEVHFWNHVDQSGGEESCWPWMKSSRNKMHGAFSMNDKKVYAHRYAYEKARGAIPDGMVVRHKCDFGLCCNPAHLELGTQTDNLRDMHRRGRGARGESNGHAKLTESEVQEIRRQISAGSKDAEVAEIFNVSRSAIKHIRRGTTWSSIPWPEVVDGA